MRKKMVIYGMVASMVFSLCGCGEKEKSDEKATEAKYDVTDDFYIQYEGEVAEENYCMDDSAYCVEQEYLPYDDVEFNTNEYNDLAENSWMSTQTSPFSTFGADVDTASYTNIRYNIVNGYDVDPASVRIEEMINYFHYDYAEPVGDDKFAVYTEYADCPWNEDTKLALVSLNTEDIDFSEAPDSKIVFLIDTSGSMYDENKLPLVQQSLCLLAENLTEKDRISIVTYAGSDTVVLEGVSGDNYYEITQAIENLEAGGATNGSAGIETAYDIAEKYFIEGGNNRVILATDGDLNVGVTSEGQLEELITEKKKSGVYLSVLGFGNGNYKDNKLETLADKGNGNYA
ncbi:MAG: von Willebrand factor type A domain-containing protein, partial [Lachnospiraceae bacterium]|nr:von Willebrand factor type A domain-containing protein [Lachnospiraceae bacterium]